MKSFAAAMALVATTSAVTLETKESAVAEIEFLKPEVTMTLENVALDEMNSEWWRRIAKFALRHAHHLARFLSEEGIEEMDDGSEEAQWWRTMAKFALRNAHHLARFLPEDMVTEIATTMTQEESQFLFTSALMLAVATAKVYQALHA